MPKRTAGRARAGSALAVAVTTSIGLLAMASPAAAARAATSASWDAGCTTVTVESNKDISNIVYRINGIDTKVELDDGTHVYQLPGTATDVWVKSGNNHSGDGPGYGQHVARPAGCDAGGGPPL
jgi:hypothetical protein